MNMEHRQVWKNSLYEPSARVPFIVSGPGVAQGKVITDTVTSLLDVCEEIHPTQCIQLRAVLFWGLFLCGDIARSGQTRPWWTWLAALSLLILMATR